MAAAEALLLACCCCLLLGALPASASALDGHWALAEPLAVPQPHPATPEPVTLSAAARRQLVSSEPLVHALQGAPTDGGNGSSAGASPGCPCADRVPSGTSCVSQRDAGNWCAVAACTCDATPFACDASTTSHTLHGATLRATPLAVPSPSVRALPLKPAPPHNRAPCRWSLLCPCSFATWMVAQGLCSLTCGRCACPGQCVCADVPPDGRYTCAQQAGAPFCRLTEQIDSQPVVAACLLQSYCLGWLVRRRRFHSSECKAAVAALFDSV